MANELAEEIWRVMPQPIVDIKRSIDVHQRLTPKLEMLSSGSGSGAYTVFHDDFGEKVVILHQKTKENQYVAFCEATGRFSTFTVKDEERFAANLALGFGDKKVEGVSTFRFDTRDIHPASEISADEFRNYFIASMNKISTPLNPKEKKVLDAIDSILKQMSGMPPVNDWHELVPRIIKPEHAYARQLN